jgi:glycosyltransferase involved in cell wall biosynthesis
MRASLALLREARRVSSGGDGSGGVDILALVQLPVPEALVFKLDGPRGIGVLEWEGEHVLVGRREALLAATASREYDVVISLSIEEMLVAFALELKAKTRYATPHNYYLPPFGPFRRFPTKPGHAQLLLRLDALLSPCEHHCAYLRRWGPKGLVARPLYAADYRYFHLTSRENGGSGVGVDAGESAGGGGSHGDAPASESGRLPGPMEPWGASHRYVTFVSPSPEKGLSLFVTLARLMPDVAFAAVATQWTGEETRAKLRECPNVTILAANPDVDVIFRQTRVLLAPSLWQECCPLVVMEACLRGVPCVSSDVFGLPEANSNPNLVMHASLSFDHARGTLLHGVSNAQLEQRLGASEPKLPTAAERTQAISAAVREEATPEEAATFVAVLRRLLDDEAYLREQSDLCRSTFLAFATSRQDVLRDELSRCAAWRREGEAAERGGGRGKETGGWVAGQAAAAASGATLCTLEPADVVAKGEGARGGEAADDDALELLPAGVTYRVVHTPFVFIRKAPSTDAEVLNMAPTGTVVEGDAVRRGWLRVTTPIQPLGGGDRRGGWVLLDGASVGLGVLLVRV